MKKKKGFTLVEVLICVGIIGIIAAITIPVLLTSTSEKALEAQRKALYSRMAQAFGQIKNLKLYEVSTEDEGGTTYTDGYSALNFITSSFGKVYKLASTCDAASIKECGVPDKVFDYYSDSEPYSFELSSKQTFTAYNEKITQADLGGLDTNYAAFKTANGESVLLYYNPKCMSKSEAQHNLARSVCVNMIYDLNGRKAPNAYGEDIGVITVFYPTDPTVVMPVLHHEEAFNTGTYEDMLNMATEKDLAAPTIEELISILINKNMTKITKDIDETKTFWSSSYSSTGTESVWIAGFGDNGVKTLNLSGSTSTSNPYFLIKK